MRGSETIPSLKAPLGSAYQHLRHCLKRHTARYAKPGQVFARQRQRLAFIRHAYVKQVPRGR